MDDCYLEYLSCESLLICEEHGLRCICKCEYGDKDEESGNVNTK